jgi:hypothetical protein
MTILPVPNITPFARAGERPPDDFAAAGDEVLLAELN